MLRFFNSPLWALWSATVPFITTLPLCRDPLLFSQTRLHWCKILTSDWLLSPLWAWSHRCESQAEGPRQKLSKKKEQTRGKKTKRAATVHKSPPFCISFLSVDQFSLHFYLFHILPLLLPPCLVSLFTGGKKALAHILVGKTFRGSKFWSCLICHPH